LDNYIPRCACDFCQAFEGALKLLIEEAKKQLEQEKFNNRIHSTRKLANDPRE